MKYLFTAIFCLGIAGTQAQLISPLELSAGSDKLRILDSHQIIHTDEIQALGIEPEKVIGDVALVSRGVLLSDFPQQQFARPVVPQIVVTLGNSNTMGITTGQVILEYYDRRDMDTLLQDYSMQLVSELEELNRFVVQINNLSRLTEALEELSNDFRVKSTELMINFGDADLQ